MSDYPFTILDSRTNALVRKGAQLVNTNGSCVKIDTNNAAGDAFGRLRVSNPETLFDSKNIFNHSSIATASENQPLYYDNVEISGTATSTEYKPNEASTFLYVSENIAGKRIRQTKRRFNYQPGKSLEIIMSFVFGTQDEGIIREEGWHDDNNGIFLRDTGTDYRIVRRTNVTGTPDDVDIPQSLWNIDKMDGTGDSGITLNFEKTQLFYVDVEWLGVGRVRTGFVIDGQVFVAHEFYNTNVLDKVYMSTPNLPLRSVIENTGTGGAASIVQICSTVISEGAQDPLGEVRYQSTEGTPVTCAVTGTIYAILGLRLKQSHLGSTIQMLQAQLQIQSATEKIEWILIFNPTVAGNPTWVDILLSGIQYFKGATANTVTGGYKIGGGFLESGGVTVGSASSVSADIKNALMLGSTIAGVSDTIVLCVRPIASSTDVAVEGALTWRELS